MVPCFKHSFYKGVFLFNWGGIMEQILYNFFNKYDKKININKLVKKLEISSKDLEELLSNLYSLEKKGYLFRDENDFYMRVPKDFYLKHGILERSNKNNCYIKTNFGNVIIYNKDLKTARCGDTVFVEILSKDSKFNKYVGRVVSVVKKIEFNDDFNRMIKGNLKKDYKNDVYFVMLDKKRIIIPFDKLNSAYPGDLVSVQIFEGVGSVVNVLKRIQSQHVFECEIKNNEINWIPIGTHKFKTKLINCNKKFVNGDRIIANINENNELVFIGRTENSNDLLNQIRLIVLDHGINFDFPDNIEDELKHLPSLEEEVSKRLDLRNLTTFTIDPETAKDLDDAISIEKVSDGYKLYVHVADVSYYVRYLSAIYEEAKTRCTSGYFGNIVRCMLPVILSEDLCSLMPGSDKLAKTLIIDLDFDGNVKDYRIFRSVINSNLKMTYEKVDDALNGTVMDEYKPFLKELYELSKLSIILEGIKQKRGYIGFKTEEYNFNIVNNEINVSSNNNGPAHLMIENCMLLANECLTSYMYWLDLPIVYRNHEVPDCTKLYNLKDDLKKHNYHIRTIKNATNPKILQKILLSISKNGSIEDVQIASKILLQYMQRAFYSEKNLGHYGLALDHYSTFTSPIRRFPDLINHLILDSFLDGNTIYEQIANDLPSICQNVNNENLKIELLEKAVNNFLLKTYIGSSGDNLSAIIKIITKDGLYVRTEDGFFGLIPIPGMRYDYVEKKAYIGDTEYKVEDEVKVRMIDVNKDYEILFEINGKKEKRIKYEY